jgi:DTW domain-containing protein YfiP
MARSAVLQSTVRCDHCRFPPRWCICAGREVVESPLQVDILMHHREVWRPTSTGLLINRVMPASRRHVFRPPAAELTRASVALPGRELWILHPRGEPVPVTAQPDQVQLLLLDGSWRESATMVQHTAGWGRLVRLPEAGPSRNALRAQENPGQYSTVESLLFCLAALGLAEAETRLRRQFELHVYVGLRARGARERAEEFMAASSLSADFPELLARLHERRPVS